MNGLRDTLTLGLVETKQGAVKFGIGHLLNALAALGAHDVIGEPASNLGTKTAPIALGEALQRAEQILVQSERDAMVQHSAEVCGSSRTEGGHERLSSDLRVPRPP